MSKLTGEIRVRAEGAGYERLLSGAIKSGAHLWDVRRDARAVVFRMPAAEFPALRPGARASQCRVKIIEKRGLTFRGRALTARLALPAGIALAAVLWLLATCFVWTVNVTGVPPDSAARITSALERAGASPGAWKRGLRFAAIESAILENYPELTYLGLKFSGLSLIAEARLMIPPPEVFDPSKRIDIIADKHGMIERVSVISGKANVRPGQIVKPGDVLVYGVTQAADGSASATGARAEVWARIWVRGTAQIPLLCEKRTDTGRIETKTAVRFLDHWLSPERSPSFAQYRSSVTRTPLLKGLFIPCEVVRYDYIEENVTSEVVELEDARVKAEILAHENASRAAPEDVVVVDKHVQFDMIEGNTVKSIVYLETRQMIGKPHIP